MIKDVAIQMNPHYREGMIRASAVIMEGVTQSTVVELRGLRFHVELPRRQVVPASLSELSTSELCALSEAVHNDIRC